LGDPPSRHPRIRRPNHLWRMGIQNPATQHSKFCTKNRAEFTNCFASYSLSEKYPHWSVDNPSHLDCEHLFWNPHSGNEPCVQTLNLALLAYINCINPITAPQYWDFGSQLCSGHPPFCSFYALLILSNLYFFFFLFLLYSN